MKADLDHPVARDFATDRVSDWGDRNHQHVLPILLAHVVAQPLGPYPLIRAIDGLHRAGRVDLCLFYGSAGIEQGGLNYRYSKGPIGELGVTVPEWDYQNFWKQ